MQFIVWSFQRPVRVRDPEPLFRHFLWSCPHTYLAYNERRKPSLRETMNLLDIRTEKEELRPLHLHTLDSLVADLVSGRPVEIGAEEPFVLPDEHTRSALEWYRKKGPTGWKASVSAQQGKNLVDTILQKPPELPALPA